MATSEVKYAVFDHENAQSWGPYDSEEEAAADIILMANQNGWREVIEAGDFPFENTGLELIELQPKSNR